MDLFWLVQGSDNSVVKFFANNVKDVFKALQHISNVVQFDSTNCHMLINFFSANVYTSTSDESYDIILRNVIELFNHNNIVIPDEFIIDCKKFVVADFFNHLLLSCIEYNKKLGTVPNNNFIKYIRIYAGSSYNDYNMNKKTIEALLANLKNVDPFIVEELFLIHNKQIRDYLILHINFDELKLKQYAFSKMFRSIDEITASVEPKRKNVTTKRKIDFSSETFATFREDTYETKTDEIQKQMVFVVEINGTELTNIRYEEYSVCSHSDVFILRHVKDVEINIQDDSCTLYRSIVHKNKFIRVFSKNIQIDILILDLADKTKEVAHYVISKSNKSKMILVRVNNSNVIKN